MTDPIQLSLFDQKEIPVTPGIAIRAYFGDWYPVSKDKAISYAQYLDIHITARNADKISLIQRHIKGLTITEELLCRK